MVQKTSCTDALGEIRREDWDDGVSSSVSDCDATHSSDDAGQSIVWKMENLD